MRQFLNPELKVAASPELMRRGCVYVISLDAIQDAIGARWGKSREAVWTHLENLLRQSLTPTDFFSRVDDTAALVSLPAATAEEAQICCLRIVHQLHTIMLGPCDPSKLTIERAVPLADGTIGTVLVSADQVNQSALRKALPRGEESPDRREKNGPSQTAPKIEFVHRFVPIWDVQKEAITAYRCQTIPNLEPGERLGSLLQFKLDLACTTACIRHAAQLLSQRMAEGNRFLAWIPLSYEMLSSPASRIEISNLCRSLSSELRPCLIFEICDLPFGVPQSRLSELAGSLRPFCRSVMAQLPARTANYGAYLGAGLHAIGLSFAASTGEEMLSETFKLGIAAERQHVMSFLLDVPNEELLLSARDRGITLLSSPLIGGAAAQPGPVKRLTLDVICKQAVSRTVAA
jgi:hypothetical protein